MIKVPALRGLIARRLLVNYRAAPEVVAPLLPSPFRPHLHEGNALVGVCLIRLESIRPVSSPLPFGFSSENAAHRFAVEWDDENGELRRGVYIARRDTASRLTQIAGGRIFPGQHFGADFSIQETPQSIDLKMKSHDGEIQIEVSGQLSSTLPDGSIFENLETASDFYRGGSVGYSARHDGKSLDGLRLETVNWHVQTLDVNSASSTYFSQTTRFPAGSVELDHVLVMRNIEHRWYEEKSLVL